MDTSRFTTFLKSKFFWIPTALILLSYVLVEIAISKTLVPLEMLTRLSAAVAVLGTLLSWIFANTQFGEKSREEIDKINFQKFLELMPPAGIMYFFEEHSFENQYPTIIFQNYDSFSSFYRQPGKKFINKDLEHEIIEFKNDLEKCIEKLSGYTSPIDSLLSGFPRELIMYNENLFQQRANELNEITSRVAKKYRTLVDKWSAFFILPH